MRLKFRAFGAAVAGAFLFVACPVQGQTPETQARADFSRLHEHLRAGDPVDVATQDGTTVRGKTLEISATSLVVLVDGSRKEIPANQVVKIERRRNGVLLGAVIGAGVGVAFGLALKSYAYNEGGNEAAALMLPIAVGLGAGIGIDALLVRSRTVFERPRQSARRLTVIVGSGHAGLRMSLTF